MGAAELTAIQQYHAQIKLTLTVWTSLRTNARYTSSYLNDPDVRPRILLVYIGNWFIALDRLTTLKSQNYAQFGKSQAHLAFW